MSEYSDIKPEITQDKMSELFNDIPDLLTIAKSDLDRYQADIRRKLADSKESLSNEQSNISEKIRNIEGRMNIRMFILRKHLKVF